MLARGLIAGDDMPVRASDGDVGMTPALSRVILSWPSAIDSTPLAGSDSRNSSSWIQIARTGAFTSERHGKFSITRDDLATMLRNFEAVTPKAPTQLPVDYDHLSLNPQHPGDGAAAGWITNLALRADGEELWAQVEWTPEGARRIARREYRFASPSFMKNYVDKDGRAIGATLLAAAITNQPFLEGMAALTLYSLSAMGDLAIALNKPVARTPSNSRERSTMPPKDPSAELLSLATTVSVERKLSLRDALIRVSRERRELTEQYYRQFDSVVNPPLGAETSHDEARTAAGEKLLALANGIMKNEGLSFRDALLRAQRQDPYNAQSYFELMTGR